MAKPQPNPPPPDEPDPVTRMMRLDPRGTRRGVDDVIDRLRQPDGWAWWAAAMQGFPPSEADDPTRAALEHLSRAKEHHKAALTVHGPQRVNSIALYYACIAAGIVHHGKRLTSQAPGPLSEAFLDLAASTPEPWAGLFARAGGKGGPN
ncbi:MAG: hypothetical protein JNM80_13075 [Phycisphaerae bacterium]|nr:hypothetical protein [Phycisphaerae bacterium]